MEAGNPKLALLPIEGNAALFMGISGVDEEAVTGKPPPPPPPKLLLALLTPPTPIPKLAPSLLLFTLKVLGPAFFSWFNGGPFGMLATNGFCGVGDVLIPTPEGVKAKGFAPPPPPPPPPPPELAPFSFGVDFFNETKESKLTKDELTPRKSSGERDLAPMDDEAVPPTPVDASSISVVSGPKGAAEAVNGVVKGDVITPPPPTLEPEEVVLTMNGSSSNSKPNPSMLKAFAFSVAAAPF